MELKTFNSFDVPNLLNHFEVKPELNNIPGTPFYSAPPEAPEAVHSLTHHKDPRPIPINYRDQDPNSKVAPSWNLVHDSYRDGIWDFRLFNNSLFYNNLICSTGNSAKPSVNATKSLYFGSHFDADSALSVTNNALFLKKHELFVTFRAPFFADSALNITKSALFLADSALSITDSALSITDSARIIADSALTRAKSALFTTMSARIIANGSRSAAKSLPLYLKNRQVSCFRKPICSNGGYHIL